MDALSVVLGQINKALWLADLPTFAILFYICQCKKKVNSSMLTMLVVLVAGFFMITYEAALTAYIEANPGPNSIVTFLWYNGLACFYAATLYYLRKVHQLKNTTIGTMGGYISKAYTVIALIYVAQYTEILLLKTDQNLDLLFSFGIPAINIASTGFFFSFAIYSLYHTIHKTDTESLRWNI